MLFSFYRIVTMADTKNAECQKGEKQERRRRIATKEASFSQQSAKDVTSSKPCDNSLHNKYQKKAEEKQGEEKQMVDNDGFEEVLSRRARKLKRQQQRIESKRNIVFARGFERGIVIKKM